MKPVGFEARIMELKVKRLVSNDKSARLLLEFDEPSDNLIDDLNRLFHGDKDVAVAIAETQE